MFAERFSEFGRRSAEIITDTYYQVQSYARSLREKTPYEVKALGNGFATIALIATIEAPVLYAISNASSPRAAILTLAILTPINAGAAIFAFETTQNQPVKTH